MPWILVETYILSNNISHRLVTNTLKFFETTELHTMTGNVCYLCQQFIKYVSVLGK